MVSDDYKPFMKPLISNGLVRISREYGIHLNLSNEEQTELKQYLVGETICPPTYSFKDNEVTRKLLKVDINE